jgi:cellulose biosynthesis protein BcsQ
MEFSHCKISELAKITGMSMPLISKHFKSYDNGVTRVNNRITGITPESVEDYFKSINLDYFYRPAIVLSANLCGGVGKTTTAINLGVCLRRISNRNEPVVFMDGDPQGSLTSLIFKEPAENKEPILIDFLQNRVTLDDILTEVGNNIWFIKSNLNQEMIDKLLIKPHEMKTEMLRVYKGIFSKLGSNTKIFQDHHPALSTMLSSSICALNQLDNSILKAVLIPIRSDSYAINGANHILNEIKEIIETFSLKNKMDIHCFFSSVDKRVSTTAEAIKSIATNENIVKHLSPIVIRYCSEIPKTIMSIDDQTSTHTNVYHSGKKNNAAEDYQDLLKYIFSYKNEDIDG